MVRRKATPAVAPPATVVAERFVLRDRDGRERAALYVDEADETVLVLGDDAHRARFRVRVRNDGSAALSLSGDDGHRILIAIGPEGTAVVTVADGAGRPRIGLQVEREGRPFLVVHDADGRPVTTVPRGPGRRPTRRKRS